LRAILSPLILVLVLRWALFEPFVIPSGSMIPTLLIHDHILVTKFSYGIRMPFFNSWLFRWSTPRAGEVIVFKYPENPDIYYIKRLIGTPGDEVKLRAGRIIVNGHPWPEAPVKNFDLTPGFAGSKDTLKDFSYFREKTHIEKDPGHLIRFYSKPEQAPEEVSEVLFKLGPGQYFFMGDNRDQSSDSRVWGMVDEKFLVGKAWLIWLSCESTLDSAPFVCDPSRMRWKRIFDRIL
jgi:signal peptidase I